RIWSKDSRPPPGTLSAKAPPSLGIAAWGARSFPWCWPDSRRRTLHLANRPRPWPRRAKGSTWGAPVAASTTRRWRSSLWRRPCWRLIASPPAPRSSPLSNAPSTWSRRSRVARCRRESWSCAAAWLPRSATRRRPTGRSGTPSTSTARLAPPATPTGSRGSSKHELPTVRRTKEATMTLVALVPLAALLMLAVVPAQAADVKQLFVMDLADYPGKEGLMLEVSYPPGARDMVHRHDAHAFVYVLEGQIIMQLKGKPAVTLKAGQTFYEGPTDIHVVGRNASDTAPARFVVVLLKGKGAPILTPVKE